jgi:histidinol-phosphate phosphatase family protein
MKVALTAESLCQAAILAGGMGTRLRSRTGLIPKPMASVMQIPVLQHQIELCRRYSFTKIALLVHYQSNLIEDFFGDGSRFGVELIYVAEREARGTAGALRDALHVMDERFIVLYGDTYADVNLREFWRFDAEGDSAGSIFAHPNDHPQDSDLIDANGDGAVVGMHSYPHSANVDHPNLVNAALYILDKKCLAEVIPVDVKSDLAKHTFPALLKRGRILRAYISPEYIKDMGTPDRLDKVERDIIEGLPERLSGRSPRSAVFVDRDGTLNIEVNHLKSPDQLILVEGAAEAVRKLNRSGLLTVGVTNQPVLARGDVTQLQIRAIHARLDALLGNSGAYLDRIYLCPHHPDRGFPGEVAELKIKCTCRKPETGLIDRAVRELNISRRDSWMIGDSTSDILAGQRAGLMTIMVRSGYAGRDFKYEVTPNFIADNISAAVDWILNGHQNAITKLMPIVLAAKDSRLILVGGASRSGKSTAASVMKELFALMGKTTHILELDGWLKPAQERAEGGGVLGRYDMNAAVPEIIKLASSSSRLVIDWPQYDRKTKVLRPPRQISVGPSDVLIVEGVPALLGGYLDKEADMSIFINVDDDLRLSRVANEYNWRGEDESNITKKIYSRELDEVLEVKLSAQFANFSISL